MEVLMNVGGVFFGVCVGIAIMCLMQAERTNDHINTATKLYRYLLHERYCAMEEGRSSQYLNGMSRLIEIVKSYFGEEIKLDERKQNNKK